MVFSAIGKNAKKILKDVPKKNSYGKNSVFDRLLSYNTYFICIGDIKTTFHQSIMLNKWLVFHTDFLKSLK